MEFEVFAGFLSPDLDITAMSLYELESMIAIEMHMIASKWRL
jgi:hypothetical protein